MDIHAIRKSNYEAMLCKYRDKLEREFGTSYGLLDKFATYCDVSPRYLSHVNTGIKKVGDKVCRKVEAAFGLPFGWMDAAHDAENEVAKLTDAEREFQATTLAVFRIAPLEAQAMMMKFLAERMTPERRQRDDEVIRAIAEVGGDGAGLPRRGNGD